MKFSSLSARQLLKMIRRSGIHDNTPRAAQCLAARIESGPRKSCIPKAKLRRAGLLPPVGAMEPCECPKDGKYTGFVISDGTTAVLIEDLCEPEFEYQGEKLQNRRGNLWWGKLWPNGKARILVCPKDADPSCKWFRPVCESNLSPVKSS